METFCANPQCRWHNEHKGGRFIQMKARNGWPAGFYCEECFALLPQHAGCKNLWDFTTTHFNGKPIHVTSLRQLRQLETQYGVRSVVANMDERHWNLPLERRA